MVFYAGHGIEVEERNFLVPLTLSAGKEEPAGGDFGADAVPVARIVKRPGFTGDSIL